METMECAGNRCRNKEPNLDEMYSYYGPTVVEHRSCEIKFTHISAENPESIVFNSNCRVKDQHCQMPDSCLIWNLNKIKNSCPYETLLETNVDLEANIKDKTVLVSHTDRIAFQIRRKTKTCNNLDVYETTENLYLTIIRAYDSWEGHKLAKGNSMIENQIKLLESEADYRQATAANTFKEMDKRSCFELKNNIQTIADTVHDDFRTITDAKGKKLQIYAYAGNIYLPECERGYKITELVETQKCYKDIPVIAKRANASIKIFLTKKKILTEASEEIGCATKQAIEIIIEDKRQIIKAEGNRAEMIPFNKRITNSKFTAMNIETNFKHFSGVEKYRETHFVPNASTLLELGELGNDHKIVSGNNLISKIWEETKVKTMETIEKIAHYVLVITLTTIVLATIAGMILTVRKCQKRMKKSKYKNVNFIRGLHEQEVEEEAIAMAERDIAYIRESKARTMRERKY